ncbi:GNAT superfamily N-acetyltransferase [Angulomicrobium tetraedrale]|uniref:GNAT superfamily N-acetyltransferase n=1 Tax=Ancylobacter tetraedralis TaxID=217068 RepID=A0A839Z7Q1_9HYPH|nr:GNAT family N-acetyltransferase [Ancylobacter tetraedralis]MBB3770760.1 GNAT superfamily N-acetyltransferase [Ancylobacter tetraedralis]
MIADTDHNPVAIDDLRLVPGFAPIVADRVWRAWWQEAGKPLAALRARLDESLGPATAAIPSSFVAHRGAEFLGTVALIESDMEDRPALTPWLAALWVEPAARGRGTGAALVRHAARAAFAAGHARLHLCATAQNAPYYHRLGWSRIEADIDGLDIFIRERVAG